MCRTYVVPLDGSSLAERALPYAIGLAQATRARLVLTRAALASPPIRLDGSDLEREQMQAVDEAQTYLSEMAESISGQVNGVEISAPYGRAPDKIIETIQTFEADAVVMATHGRTGLPHLLYGSVTEAVLAKSSVPVFVVYARPTETFERSFSTATARLLVPQDGSIFDTAALQTALDLVGPAGEIVLVTVAQPPRHVEIDQSGRRVLAYLDQQEEARSRDAREYLASLVNGLREQHVDVPIRIDVRLGDPVSGIAMAATDAQADLVVMSTHGRTGLRRAAFGSVAGAVVRTVHAPVVLVHANQGGATREPQSANRGELVPMAPMF